MDRAGGPTGAKPTRKRAGQRRRSGRSPPRPGVTSRSTERGRALIDHVNNLKLQYLVELSERCADLEGHLARWLHEHDVVFNGSTIPFVLMPHFVSPGQLRRVCHSVEQLCRGGRHAGSITRISDGAVINVSAGGGLLPSVIGRHKRRLLAEEDEPEEIAHGI